jgi:replicative DNA helicase
MSKSIHDRLPPFSEEAEQGTLGCILLAPNISIPFCLARVDRGREIFYDLRHQGLFDALTEMYDRSELIEPIVLGQYLRDRNQLEAFGGMPYIAGLMNCVPSAASLEYYFEIVLEKAYLRSVIQECTSIVANIYDGNVEIEALKDEIESRIMRLTQKTDKKESRRESLRRVVSNLEDMHQGKEIPGLLKTGFPDLDHVLGGLYPGDQIVIAARPGLGKSTLAMNIAEFNAIDCKNAVGYFSLEMSQDKLNMRSLASRSGIDLSIFKDQRSDIDRAVKTLTVTLAKLEKAQIEIEFTPGISIMHLRAKARQMAQESKIKLLVVDMLQLVTGRSPKRAHEVGEVSRGLKALAGELGIPVISISSMNRDIERSDNRRPRLSDLRESGDIESDADVVMFLWQKDPTSEKNGCIDTEVFIAKNRNGATDELQLVFRKPISRFESASKVSDVPSE